MAQLVVSWFICDGRFRVHAINAVGRRSGRIIEIEDIDTGERVHGSSRRLERLMQTLRLSSGELDHASPLTPDTTLATSPTECSRTVNKRKFCGPLHMMGQSFR